MTSPARYRFSDGARIGVLLGMSMRQALPIVVGVHWLTLMLMAGIPIVGILGLSPVLLWPWADGSGHRSTRWPRPDFAS